MLFIKDGWVCRRASTGTVARVEEVTEESMFHNLGLVYSPGRAKALASGAAILTGPVDEKLGASVTWEGGDPDKKYGRISLSDLGLALAIAYSTKG